MFTRWKFQIGLTVVVVVLAALAGAFIDEPAAYAQGGDNDYVDVGLTLEVRDHASTKATQYDLDIIVVNHGSRTAYDVEVVVNIVYPEDSSHFDEAPKVPVGIASLDNNERTLRWSIPSLGGLQREQVIAYVSNESVVAPIFDYKNYPHEHFGKVTTSSFQSNRHKGNDTARVWSYRSALNHSHYDQADGNYSVLVSVDGASPSPGDAVNFTITAERTKPSGRPGLTPPLIDLKIATELTSGLSVSGTPTYEPATRPASVSYSNGVFNVGTLKAGDLRKYSVTLPIAVASSAAVNKQCLTATLAGNPPPGVGEHDDDISDNVAKVCLGEPPDRPVVFNSGESGLHTWYNCVGRATYPCSATDSVEFLALGGSAAFDAGLPYGIFKPDKVVIHVPDPFGRATSSEDGSSDMVWSTGYDQGTKRSGVILSEEMVSLDFSQWGVAPPDSPNSRNGTLNVEVSGPGKMSAWSNDDNDNGPWEWYGTATNGALTSGSWPLGAGAWYAEFSKLGTYTVDFDGQIAKNNGTPTDTTDDTTYTIAERTYTFHVGPMAELEVRDGGDSSYAAADQNALTVVAANYGPSWEADAQVKIALPSGALGGGLRRQRGNLCQRRVEPAGIETSGLPALPGQTGGCHADPHPEGGRRHTAGAGRGDHPPDGQCLHRLHRQRPQHPVPHHEIGLRSGNRGQLAHRHGVRPLFRQQHGQDYGGKGHRRQWSGDTQQRNGAVVRRRRDVG